MGVKATRRFLRAGPLKALAAVVTPLAMMAAVPSLLASCQPSDDPAFSYYEERIGPALVNSCSRGPAGSGCHLPQSEGTALGNLDISSYDALMRRRDVLSPYGPYPVGLLLLKAGDNRDIQVETWNPDADNRYVTITTDIRHNAGSTVDLGSSAYAQLQQWINAGHTRSGIQDETLVSNSAGCESLADHPDSGRHPLYDPSANFSAQYGAFYQRFNDEVAPVLQETCAGSSCHGSTIADLFLTCGETDAERHWNFWVSIQHMTAPASTSGFLRRPLSTFRGGVFHEGGNVFGSADDPGYQTLFQWTTDFVDAHPEGVAPPTEGISAGLQYFADRVQPVLVRKGCMFLNCHSPSMFHDLRLSGGSGGHFSRVATYRNYESARLLLALDASDPNESRLIAKNLYPPEQVSGMPGLFHRGGSLFEDFGAAADGSPNGATPDDCDAFDADTGDLNDVPAYCIMARWYDIEREEAIASGEIASGVDAVFYVSAPTGVGEPRDFDTYRGGMDLLRATSTLAADGAITVDPGSSVLGGCGLDAGTAQIRGVAVAWDASRVAFGARSSASEPLRLYWMNPDGSGCEPIPGVAPSMDEQNGVLTHDFDPAFAPDNTLVFASTRGYSDEAILGVTGPTRTPAAMQPNANIYVLDSDGVRQLTYLLNQEMMPSFMTDGRAIFTTEKREPDFHQLAGRRQNVDGGDYHPLFAQRDSVGYQSATEIRSMLDQNLVFVAAPLDAADGGGQIALINRSIGPDQDDRAADDRFYISSQRFVSPAGVYRSPYPLPSGRLLVSCDRAATDVTAGNFAYALCELDPDSRAVRELVPSGGRAIVTAAAVYSRAGREVFESRIDEANGHTEVIAGETDAQVRVVDFPVLASLLFENTRVGRQLRHDVGGFDVFGTYPPPTSATSFGDVSGDTQDDAFGTMYVRRELLGHVDLNADGSAAFRYPGGLPVILRVTGMEGEPLMFEEGAPFTGEMIQREQMQFYPGERANQSFRRELFNGMCGGCHGSISGRELDIAVNIDVLTRASMFAASDEDPISFGL
ncbi:MAG: TolB family protein [Sandaracinaceae bacterium]